MHVEWSPELSVGVEEIDNQHKLLIENINNFFDAMEKGEDLRELIRLFHFLADYAKSHFFLEESYMVKYYLTGHIYHDEKVHKAEHKAFARDFSAFQEELESANVNQLVIPEFKNWITNWLHMHLLKIDKGLGTYLNEVFPFVRTSK